MYSIKLYAKMREVIHPLPVDSPKWKMKQLEVKVTPQKEGERQGLRKSWPHLLGYNAARMFVMGGGITQCCVFPSVLHNLQKGKTQSWLTILCATVIFRSTWHVLGIMWVHAEDNYCAWTLSENQVPDILLIQAPLCALTVFLYQIYWER